MMKEQNYKCTKCGATDVGRFMLHEHPFPVINCYKCHAGYQKDRAQMFQNQEGMFPEGDVREVD